jgi:DNA-binding GntR family transcriptional regulator
MTREPNEDHPIEEQSISNARGKAIVEASPPQERPEIRELVATQVANHLRTALVSGEIRPGGRITQDQVAKELGVSKIPVREALLRLQAEGLITLLPHSGARVPLLDASELLEIYEMRESLEPLAVRHSVPGLTNATITQLRELSRAIGQAAQVNDIGEWVNLDRSFHLLILSRAPSRMVRTLESLWNASQHYRRKYLVLPDRFAVAALDHELLLTAIEAGDADDAELVALVHIRRTRKALVGHRELLDRPA